jgi:hypothetical protein
MKIPNENRLIDHNGGGMGTLMKERIAKSALKIAVNAMNLVHAIPF